jgi:predicted nucleic acid-binding protein
MKVLVDANVVLDVVLDRAPHADAASEVLERLESGADRGFIAWHSISNIFYLMDATGPQVRKMLQGLLAFASCRALGRISTHRPTDRGRGLCLRQRSGPNRARRQ